jgi:hypothetical protein
MAEIDLMAMLLNTGVNAHFVCAEAAGVVVRRRTVAAAPDALTLEQRSMVREAHASRCIAIRPCLLYLQRLSLLRNCARCLEHRLR